MFCNVMCKYKRRGRGGGALREREICGQGRTRGIKQGR